MSGMPSDDDPRVEARRRLNALPLSLEAREGRPVQLVDTHISWVLLSDSFAYKLKKPVQLPVLDFRTLAARRLNRRLAPSLYVDVVEIRDSPTGAGLGGAGPVLDVAVRMRRFPDRALWSERVVAGMPPWRAASCSGE